MNCPTCGLLIAADEQTNPQWIRCSVCGFTGHPVEADYGQDDLGEEDDVGQE